MEIVKYIYQTMVYAEVNTKSDYCQKCGYDGEIEIIDKNGSLSWRCPNCGNEDKGVMIETFELTDNITYKIPRIFIKNNYLKMHGKSMNRRVAGRKGVRKK